MKQQDNVKAGLFVLLGIILALVVIFTLADIESLTRQTKPVAVFYQLADGVQGLKPGAAVTLGDQPVGTVESISPHYKKYDDGSEQIVGLTVTLQIPEKIIIFWDAQIELVVPPLGSGTRLNIASVGGSVGITSQAQRDAMEYRPGNAMPATVVPDWSLALDQKRSELKPDELLKLYPGPADAIPGSIAGSPLIRDMTVNMGIEAKQRQEIQVIIENVAAITSGLRGDLPQVTSKARKAIDSTQILLDKAKVSLEKVDVSLENIKTITTELNTNSKVWQDKITTVLNKADNAVDTLNDLVVEEKQTVKDSLANIKVATADARDMLSKLKTDTLDQLNTAMTQVKQTAENLKSTSTKIRDFVAGAKPVLENTMARAQISAEQLSLATIEIRRSPWRLLHTPSEDELETDNLYDAARSFALAAGALQAASASLDSVTSQQQVDPKQVQEMVEHLSTLFEKFKSTEKIFWDTLNKYGQKK
jgi:ABC-type transporter Mla subunit MlaD